MQEVLPQCTIDLLVSSFVFHSSLLTAKSVDLVVACDGFLCIIEIVIHLFHSGYLDYPSGDLCLCIVIFGSR